MYVNVPLVSFVGSGSCVSVSVGCSVFVGSVSAGSVSTGFVSTGLDSCFGCAVFSEDGGSSVSVVLFPPQADSSARHIINHAVRGARIKNEQIRASNELERKQAAEEGREVDPDKIKAERYIWQDDLRQRVKEAAARATDEQSFAHQLRLSGVELVPVKNKDKQPIRDENRNLIYLHPATKKQPAYYTYELVDISGFPDKIPKNLKSKAHKLGTNYLPEAIAKLFSTASPSVQDDQEDVTPNVVFEGRTRPDAEDQYDAPPVFFEPSPRRRKPQKNAEKPKPETTEKSLEEKAMDDARNIARTYAFTLMRRVYGWQRATDIDELNRQHQERDAAFEQFTEWRVDRRKELARNGEKLPGIYVKNKSSDYVSVPRGEFEKQFAEFLDKRDHPEKYAAIQEQPEQQPAPVEQPQRVKPEKLPEQAKLTERARQEIAEGRSILYAELQRINAANEKRWAEQEQQNGGEKDSVIKS